VFGRALRITLGTLTLAGPLTGQVYVMSAPGPTDYASANTAGLTAMWLIRNDGTGSVTIWLSCARVDRIVSCSIPTNVVIGPHSVAPATVTFSTGSAGFGRVTINAHTTTCPPNACLSYDGGTNRTVRSVQSPTSSSISINPAPHNGDYRDVSKCVAECFDATLNYTTPAYVTMDMGRSVTISYRSSQAKPLGLVQVDATDNTAPAPDKMSILLKRPDGTWVPFTNDSTQIFFSSGSGTSRLAAQFDASALSSGAYDYTVVARSWRGANFQEATYPIRVLVVNEIASVVGAGWSIAGLQKLFVRSDASLAIVEGDGSIAFFQADLCPSSCAFVTPAGDFTTVSTIGTYPTIAGYTRRYPDGTVASFTTAGRLSSVADRFGNQTTYGYDGSGNLSTVTDPAGKVITFVYNAAHLSYIQDPGGRLTWITSDPYTGYDIRYITDAMGVVAYNPSYDASHRMTQRLDRRGSPFAFAYDFAGKLAADTMPTITADGQSVRPVVQYSSTENAVLINPASGQGTSGNPGPRVIPDSVRAIVTNPRGYATRYELDRLSAPLRIEGPLGRTSKFSRNSQGQVVADTTASGHITEYTWSGPRLTKRWDRTSNRITNFDYELTYNQVLKVYGDLDTLVNTWTGGKLMSTRQSNKLATTFTYDSHGRVSTKTDPLGGVTTYWYASTAWQNTDSVSVGGRRTRYTYDGYGRRMTVKDPSYYVTSFRYDSINRPVMKIGPVSDTTRTDFDSLYVRSITDPLGQRYQYNRNALGWVQIRTDPALRQDVYSYDRSGNRTQWVNRRNQTVSFAYDALDQIASRTADGATTTFQYDPLQQFQSASNTESTDTIKFDVAGRVQSEITVLAATRYERRSTYDVRNLRTSLEMLAPWDDTLSFHYNVNMVLDTLTDFRGGRTRLRYNQILAIDTIELAPPGVLISLIEQPNHFFTQITYSDQFTNSLIGLEFKPDSSGRIEARGKVGWDSSWVTFHDPLGRVSHFMSQPFSYDSIYTYDKAGNRTDLNRHRIAGNRLDTFNTDSLFYDADGNLIKRRRAGADIQRLYWNSLGLLIAVWTSGSDSITFGYDSFGRRVRKTTSLSTVRYIWDGDDLLAEVNGSGARLAEYAYYPGIDRPNSVRQNGPTGPTYYFAQDQPGNVIALFDTLGGSPVLRYRYSPFGTDLPGFPAGYTWIGNTLRFAARQLDVESGLYYVRARYYDPALSRFISEDPIGLQGGINQYVYACNDPVDLTDPNGDFSLRSLCGDWCLAVFGFIALTLTGGIGPALIATAATAAGSALFAAVEAIAFGESFESTFRRDFNMSEAVLGTMAAAAKLFGGGVVKMGANGWFQGYVQSRDLMLGGGGFTFGSGSIFSGVAKDDPMNLAEPLITYGIHEAGHTVQFIELSVAFGKWAPVPYLALGGMGLLYERAELGLHRWAWDNAVGRFWENNATSLGLGGIW